jgi:2,3-dimethylmalate lyase
MGAFDAITAKLAEACGAQAIFVSGFVACGVEAGEPDVGALSQRDMFEHIRRMCRATSLPAFADGFDLVYRARLLNPSEAQSLHLVNEVVPRSRVLARADANERARFALVAALEALEESHNQ